MKHALAIIIRKIKTSCYPEFAMLSTASFKNNIYFEHILIILYTYWNALYKKEFRRLIRITHKNDDYLLTQYFNVQPFWIRNQNQLNTYWIQIKCTLNYFWRTYKWSFDERQKIWYTIVTFMMLANFVFQQKSYYW